MSRFPVMYSHITLLNPHFMDMTDEDTWYLMMSMPVHLSKTPLIFFGALRAILEILRRKDNTGHQANTHINPGSVLVTNIHVKLPNAVRGQEWSIKREKSVLSDERIGCEAINHRLMSNKILQVTCKRYRSNDVAASKKLISHILQVGVP
jgi:hypothetical protein